MDLDNLKNIWSEEKVTETPEISLEQQKEIHLPLEKIRKNMRMEFYFTVFFLVFIILFLIFKDMHFFKFKVYVITLVSAQMLITAFYFSKFFNLYKNLTEINLNTKDALKDLKFQFKLNEQYYLAFYISFVPFVICELLLVFETVPYLKSLVGIKFILIFLACCFLMLIMLFTMGKWWFHHYYGRYINKIVSVSDDLK